MGKSQETFNKKEKEKKRQRKKKEKEEKKEERKSNSAKGKGMDEMIAYVDADGNITETPPDPTKKKKINQEDIQIKIEKQEAPDPADLIRTGKITYFNTSKGYGFIKDLENQDSVFVHINGLLDDVKENDKVTFETEMGMKGLNAIKVKLVK